MTNQEFLSKWLGGKYREDPKLWYQCVALAKIYYEEVFWVKWLSFGNSAINGWLHLWNLQDILDVVTQPQLGDMVFFDKTLTNPSWHVGIYQDQKTLLEENGGKWTSTGLGVDAIRLWKMPTNIVGYMRSRETDVQARVRKFVEFYWLRPPSTTQPYTQFETCTILSLMK